MSGGSAGSGELVEPPAIPGFVHLRSEQRASATADRLAEIVRAKGLTVFARIDFSKDAATAGLTMPPMIQLVFGNSRAGTPLLVANPVSGLALPLRALAWEDADGHSWLSYEAPATLIERFRLPTELTANIAGLRALCEAAVS
ncbi:MAG TPA: DUF302 domain-containing protein [Gemmatimonadaceae bacterium]|nr:DUF302 domain-containing protein [Gemmatimonadaceae bacterium]